MFRTNLKFVSVNLKGDHVVAKRFKKKDQQQEAKLVPNDLERYANRENYKTSLSKKQSEHKKGIR